MIQAQQLTSHEVELLLKEVVAEEKVEMLYPADIAMFLRGHGVDPLLFAAALGAVAGGGLYSVAYKCGVVKVWSWW